MLARLAWLALVLPVALHPGTVGAQPHGHATPPGAADRAPIFDLGAWSHPITTSSPEAQRYFDQGLVLTYGFNHAQAIIAFEQAAKLDPRCAMAYWGIALALGPNINLPMEPSAEGPAWQAARRARSLAKHASPAEREFIEAVARRYADPGDRKRPSRAALDSAYATAMREVWRRHPADADAGALFAEALMNLSPWNYWGPDGTARPGTDEIVATLESALKVAPDHPGANHFYIHAVEASRDPRRALPSAERLAGLVPDAGHLVHMPAHVWHRMGRYADSEEINVKAARVDSLYVANHGPQGFYPMMYYPHNVHFIWYSALMQGRSAVALAAARRLEPMVPVSMLREMPMLQFVAPATVYAMVRFGRWAEILAAPPPPADLRFTRGMWHYARGLALAAVGRTPEAAIQHDTLTAIAAATPPEETVSFNSSARILRLAAHALAGEIAGRRGRTDMAIRFFQDAIAEESQLLYDEPPAWYLPVRQQLGAVLLEAGRVSEAEAAYREDLARHPENGWSLYGLARCLRARKADVEAAEVEARFEKAWARADVRITASRF